MSTNIALVGKARSGKDSFANYIKEVNPEIQVYALAKPIKEFINILFGLSEEVAEGIKDIMLRHKITLSSLKKAVIYFGKLSKEVPKSLPYLYDYWEMLVTQLQFSDERGEYVYTGTLRKQYQEFGTEFGRSLDPDVWLKLAPISNVVITDVRFQNEAKWFKDLGFSIVSIQRDTKKYDIREHSSEQSMPAHLLTTTIHNNMELVDLKDRAIELLDNLDNLGSMQKTIRIV